MGQKPSLALLSTSRIEEAFKRRLGASSSSLSAVQVAECVQELLLGTQLGDDVELRIVQGVVKGGGGSDVEAFKRRLLEALAQEQQQQSSQSRPDLLSQSLKLSLDSVHDVEEESLPDVYDPGAAEKRGHVFVTLTDLRKLHCDCFAIPTGANLIPGRHWVPGKDDPVAVAAVSNLQAEPPESKQAVRIIPNWPSNRGQPICVNTHRKHDESAARQPRPNSSSNILVADLEWLHRALAAFLEAAKAFCQGKDPLCRRAKHLVALPLLGSGAAGGRHASGQLIREMLPVLYGFTNANNIDIALCTVEKSQWAVMQLERTRFDQEMRGWVWSSLPCSLRKEAARIAELASLDQLVLFLGAGTSVGAGLPSWGALLEKLARKAMMTPDDIQGLKGLNFLDQARMVALRLGGQAALAQAIASECNSPVFSLVHALLASLPVKECITSNYDPCFEMASRLPPSPNQRAPVVAVLPWAPASDCDRWLLKIHGCVTRPSEIVLTREDYLRYETRRAALMGVLQALLITKHVLFVGFSLNDDNFHKSVDSVRRATSSDDGSEPRVLGTALFLLKERFVDELWGKDLNILPMRETAAAPAPKDWADSARILEIFLDYAASLTMERGKFFRDPKFDFCLSNADIAFRDSLQKFLVEAESKWGAQSPFVSMFKGALDKTFGKNAMY